MADAPVHRLAQGNHRLDAQIENAVRGEVVRPRGGRWGRRCPHCKSPSVIRTSAEITPNYLEFTRICLNVYCGCIWVDCVNATRILSASMTPDLTLRLPMSNHIKKANVVAHLDGGSCNSRAKNIDPNQGYLSIPDPHDPIPME